MSWAMAISLMILLPLILVALIFAIRDERRTRRYVKRHGYVSYAQMRDVRRVQRNWWLS